MHPFKDLRAWLTFLKRHGNLIENNKQVSIDGDINVISKRVARTGAAAIVHNNIEGYPGWRIHTDGLSTRDRILWALNIGAENSTRAIAAKMEKTKPVKPIKVNTGQCKELIFFDNDVDLSKMPALITGEFQTTPYITAGISFIKDPETGWTNAAIRRFQVIGKNEICCLVLPHQHEGMIFSKYKNQRRAMPVSIVIGADPLVYLSCLPSRESIKKIGEHWAKYGL